MKKQPKAADRSIVGPMLKPIIDANTDRGLKEVTAPCVDSQKLQPAAEYQDDGSGFNSNFVFPQE